MDKEEVLGGQDERWICCVEIHPEMDVYVITRKEDSAPHGGCIQEDERID